MAETLKEAAQREVDTARASGELKLPRGVVRKLERDTAAAAERAVEQRERGRR